MNFPIPRSARAEDGEGRGKGQMGFPGNTWREGRQRLTLNNEFVLSCRSGTDLFPLSSSEHVILGVLVFFLQSLPEMTFSFHSSQ